MPPGGTFDQTDLDSRFAHRQLLPDPLPNEPLRLLRAWFDSARQEKAQPNPDAMALATIDADGRPSARIVLCKRIDDAGYLVFFTNYRSRKGRALAANPRAAAVFHWDSLDKQARIEGVAVPSPDDESDAYFVSRPFEARLGAWASQQSDPIASRAALIEQIARTASRLGVSGEASEVPRPPHWGGYRLWADRVELWSAGPGRLHDRAVWARGLAPAGPNTFAAGPWSAIRLQP